MISVSLVERCIFWYTDGAADSFAAREVMHVGGIVSFLISRVMNNHGIDI